MRFCYADPPYIGRSYMYKKHEDYGGEVDHGELIKTLCSEFEDGWALSCSSPSLRVLLPLCPEKTRVGAWVKPFCSFKPNVKPAFAWEPVIFYKGRKLAKSEKTTRDWGSANVTLKKGLPGAKPWEFCWWVFELLGMKPDDELVDMFPGTGIITEQLENWRRYKSGLF